MWILGVPGSSNSAILGLEVNCLNEKVKFGQVNKDIMNHEYLEKSRVIGHFRNSEGLWIVLRGSGGAGWVKNWLFLSILGPYIKPKGSG